MDLRTNSNTYVHELCPKSMIKGDINTSLCKFQRYISGHCLIKKIAKRFSLLTYENMLAYSKPLKFLKHFQRTFSQNHLTDFKTSFINIKSIKSSLNNKLNSHLVSFLFVNYFYFLYTFLEIEG